jgi:hypothetical protein
MLFVKVTRNRGKATVWGCPLGALPVAVQCIKLMIFNLKSSRQLKITSARVSGRLHLLEALRNLGRK